MMAVLEVMIVTKPGEVVVTPMELSTEDKGDLRLLMGQEVQCPMEAIKILGRMVELLRGLRVELSPTER